MAVLMKSFDGGGSLYSYYMGMKEKYDAAYSALSSAQSQITTLTTEGSNLVDDINNAVDIGGTGLYKNTWDTVLNNLSNLPSKVGVMMAKCSEKSKEYEEKANAALASTYSAVADTASSTPTVVIPKGKTNFSVLPRMVK